MRLTFSPVRMDQGLEVFASGDSIMVNGDVLDFSPLPAGATLPRQAIDCPWIAGDVSRAQDGELTIPLILPHGANAPHETLFPAALVVQAEAGGAMAPVAIPQFDQEAANVED